MATRLSTLRATDISPDLWADISALRTGQPHYANPFFDPALARIIGAERSDTHVIIGEDSDGLRAAWPLHLRPGGWARPLGGPFSDWNGPLLRTSVRANAADLLMSASICGVTT